MTASGMADLAGRDSDFIVGRAKGKSNSWGLVIPDGMVFSCQFSVFSQRKNRQCLSLWSSEQVREPDGHPRCYRIRIIAIPGRDCEFIMWFTRLDRSFCDATLLFCAAGSAEVDTPRAFCAG